MDEWTHINFDGLSNLLEREILIDKFCFTIIFEQFTARWMYDKCEIVLVLVLLDSWVFQTQNFKKGFKSVSIIFTFHRSTEIIKTQKSSVYGIQYGMDSQESRDSVS